MRSTATLAFVFSSALLGSGIASAQRAPGPLDQYLAESESDTPLQFSVGTAIQGTCQALAAIGGSQIPDPAQRDLFLRCNEIVQTASELNGSQTPPPRSLGFTDAQLAQTLQQYAGEEIAALADLAARAPSGQFSNIAGRLNALRLGAGSVGARARVAGLVTPDRAAREPRAFGPATDQLPRSLRNSVLPHYSLLSAAQVEGAAAPAAAAPAVESPWGWFTEATYGFGDRDPTVNEDGFDFDSYSATLGIDYNFGNGVIGASIGYDDYSADFDVLGLAVAGGDAEIRGASASLFAAFAGERASFNAIASYGEPESDVTRVVIYEETSPCTDCGTLQSLTGSPDARYFSFGATLAFDGRVGSWDLTPSVSLSIRNAEVDGYTESNSTVGGGLALVFEDQSIDSNRSIVALDLSRAIDRNFGVLVPSFRAEWHHEFEDEARTLTARFAFAPTMGVNPLTGNCFACFSFVTDTPDRDFGVVGAGLTFVFPSRIQAYVFAESVLGARDLSSSSIALGLRGQF